MNKFKAFLNHTGLFTTLIFAFIGSLIVIPFSIGECGITRAIMLIFGWIGFSILGFILTIWAKNLVLNKLLAVFIYFIASTLSLVITFALLDYGASYYALLFILITPAVSPFLIIRLLLKKSCLTFKREA